MKFLEIGNVIAVLEGKAVAANLSVLNRAYLHNAAIRSLLASERASGRQIPKPFSDSAIYRKELAALLKRARSLSKRSPIPDRTDFAQLTALPIMRRVNPLYWLRLG